MEESILNCLLGQLASEAFVDEVLSATNAYLSELVSKPAVDVAPLRKLIAKKEASRSRMLKKLEDAEDDQSFNDLYEVAESLLRDIQQLKSEVAAASLEPSVLTPIQHDDLKVLVGSLHDLLYENSSLAGTVLDALTGPIKIIQSEPLRGKRRPQWTAEFTLNHAKVFVEIARQLNCPTKDTWEFLSIRNWTMGTSNIVEVKTFKNAEKLAKTAFEMWSSGTSVNAVAIALGVEPETIESAIALWEAGNRCNLPPNDYRFRRKLPASKVDRITPDVVRMVDEEKMSITAVAKKLGVGQNIASKAYKQSKGDQLAAMAKAGEPVKIPAPLKLSREKHKRIRELLLAGGMSCRAIAREVGCAHQAVSEAHKRMKADDAV